MANISTIGGHSPRCCPNRRNYANQFSKSHSIIEIWYCVQNWLFIEQFLVHKNNLKNNWIANTELTHSTACINSRANQTTKYSITLSTINAWLVLNSICSRMVVISYGTSVFMTDRVSLIELFGFFCAWVPKHCYFLLYFRQRRIFNCPMIFAIQLPNVRESIPILSCAPMVFYTKINHKMIGKFSYLNVCQLPAVCSPKTPIKNHFRI